MTKKKAENAENYIGTQLPEAHGLPPCADCTAWVEAHEEDYMVRIDPETGWLHQHLVRKQSG